MVFVQYVLPYLVTLAVGIISYFSAIRTCKLDNDIKIKEIQEKHKLDLENQKEMFKLEMEKINLQHQNELEKLKVESNNQLANSLASSYLTSVFSEPQKMETKIKELIEIGNKIKNDKK